MTEWTITIGCKHLYKEVDPGEWKQLPGAAKPDLM